MLADTEMAAAMNLRRLVSRMALVLTAFALIAVACGSDDVNSDAADVTASTATATETEVTATEPTSEPTAEPDLTPEPTSEPAVEEEQDGAEDAAASSGDQSVGVYDAPGELEIPLPLPAGEPGELIDTEEITVGSAPGVRIAYHSTAADGEPVAVTGFAAWPDGEVPEGGWPLIAWAHGTTGLGDRCAPSHSAESDALALALLTFGYAVVATDYEGLGTPGTHPYVVGASEAYGVLDSVRAVQALDLPVTDRWVAFGHSQGGHAAMFTGQLQPTYAPELEMIGVVAGAPPSQQSDLGDSLVGGDFQGYLVMTAAGLVAAYDELSLTDVLSAEAIELIDVVETGCTGEIFDVYNPLEYDDVAVGDPFELADWSAALLANDTNQLPVEAPLLIIHGEEDEQIPIETSAALFGQLCAFSEQGPTVRKTYAGQSHAGVLTSGAAIPDLLSWVQGRFADAPALDECGS